MHTCCAPVVEGARRTPWLAWPREIPIAGEPADVVAVVSRYRDALCQSQLPKLLFTVEPGMLVPAPLVAWCRASLPKLDVIALGRGLHFVQEDHPDRKSTRLNSSHQIISYAVFCLEKKNVQV